MNRLVIDADLGVHTISRHVYGHFSEHLGRCIYDGFWVGEDSPIPNLRGIRTDVVEALKAIRVPNLRWPGGCFADDYHWMDGIGPRKDRPSLVNVHWGGVTENNHFGTHEFMDLCGQLGCEPYLCGNVGSGTVREMSQWVEYLTFGGRSPMADLRREHGREEPWKVAFWGVGNENWGCGGDMRPEFYADLYRRYRTYLRSSPGNVLRPVACGSYNDNYAWTDVLMRECAGRMWGLSYHYYCGSGKQSRSATRFDESDWFHQLASALRLDEYLARHATVMDRHDPGKRVALVVDEWGAWHEVEPGTNPGFLYQQNTLRDALVAGLTLNILNAHSDRVRMANLAQTVNVLQAPILTEGAAMVRTPTYHVFEMYAAHQEATLVPAHLESESCGSDGESIPRLSASASVDARGVLHLSICNTDPGASAELACVVRGRSVSHAEGRTLTAAAVTAHNTFAAPDAVKPVAFDDVSVRGDKITIRLPSKSVTVLEVR